MGNQTIFQRIKVKVGQLWFAILFLWVAFGAVYGSEPPSLTVELEPEKAFVGDVLTYTVTFGASEGWLVEETSLPERLGKATVLKQGWHRLQEDPSVPARQQLKVELAFFELGDQEVPKQTFVAKGPDGEAVELVAPALPMEIEALLKDADQTLADNKGQANMDVPFFWLLLIAGLALLVLLILLGFYLYIRWKKPKPKPVIPPKPPYEEALGRLGELTSSSLLKEGRVKEFYVAIHQVLRHYVHRLFDIQAEEMTSFEFEEWLEGEAGVPGPTKDLFLAFQELCDRVKFAKYEPIETETKDLVNHAYQIVESLRHVRQEVADVQIG